MNGGGALESSVTLDEVFAVLGAKRVPLAPELAGYLVLEIAEHADPSGGDVDPRSVFVGAEGTVALVKPRRDAAGGDVEASVRSMLARLLDASGSQTPALAAASKRRSGSGLPALAAELETALIPVNRAAGRRALARLAREVRRILLGVGRNALPSSSDAAVSPRRTIPPAPASSESRPPASSTHFSREEEPTTTRRPVPNELLDKGTPSEWTELPTSTFDPGGRIPSPSQADVDALIDQFGVSAEGDQQHAHALKAMAGLEPTPPPPAARDRPALRRRPSLRAEEGAVAGPEEGSEIESLLSLSGGAVESPRRASAASVHERQLPTQPSLRKSGSTIPSLPPSAAKRRSFVPVLALIAVAGGAYAVWELRPGPAVRPTPDLPIGSAKAPAAQAVAACNGVLLVTNVPTHAEVLLREGQAPVDVEKMPVGARLEFVATAEGYAPKRVVVPLGASWDPGPDGKPRFEAAVQLDKSPLKSGTDAWPSGEPGSEVGGQGPPGTVHVVATPRGAEIWMLAGIGPEARVAQIRCDRDLDVLVAGPTTFRKRLHVSAADFLAEEAPGSPPPKVPVRMARLSVK